METILDFAKIISITMFSIVFPQEEDASKASVFHQFELPTIWGIPS